MNRSLNLIAYTLLDYNYNVIRLPRMDKASTTC